MNSTSSFSSQQPSFPDAELLPVGGSTCQCYRVRLYGKLHFLKRLKPQLRTNPRYVAALQKEFETGYPLEHPHLVRYAAKTEDGILMDYVDGETLDQFAESHPDYFRNRKNADRFLRQLLSVVGYLHQHQIVHLDLKPQNILVTRIGHDVKLIDLGYCYTDTYTDTTGRTDKYAAPEQLDGSAKADARTDIYAIGRILQTLPCAHYYNKVIQRCTQTDPAKRYQSIEEIASQMERSKRWGLMGADATRRVPTMAAILFLILSVSYLLYQTVGTRRVASVAPSSAQQAPVPSPKTDTVVTQHVAPASSLPPSSGAEQRGASTPSTASAPAIESVRNNESQPVVESSILIEDTLALRRELQSLIGPRFQQTLGHYTDSIFDYINEERFCHEWGDFEESLIPIYIQVWAKYEGKVSKHTMESEWLQTIMLYRVTQFWQMKRNAPDHDPFYDGKVFHYYEYNP